MWIACDRCGRKIRVRTKEVWMVQWVCRCGYKNYKVNQSVPRPFEFMTVEEWLPQLEKMRKAQSHPLQGR